MAKTVSRQKAKKILHGGMVHGHKLTEKQRKFFGVKRRGK